MAFPIKEEIQTTADQIVIHISSYQTCRFNHSLQSYCS